MLAVPRQGLQVTDFTKEDAERLFEESMSDLTAELRQSIEAEKRLMEAQATVRFHDERKQDAIVRVRKAFRRLAHPEDFA